MQCGEIQMQTPVTAQILMNLAAHFSVINNRLAQRIIVNRFSFFVFEFYGNILVLVYPKRQNENAAKILA